LGGKTYWLDELFNPTHELADGCESNIAGCKVIPKIEEVDSNEDIEVMLGTEVIGVSGEAPDLTVKVIHDGDEKELEVGAIVVATGAKGFDPTPMKEYRYGENEDIITSVKLVELLKENPGELKRPSDGKVPSNVNFVQCVGSRDKHRGCPYCSVICCTFSVSFARRIKEMHPDTGVYVHHIDLRGTYHGFEDLLTRAQEKKVIFIKGRVGEIVLEDGNIVVRSEEIDTGDLFFIDSDLVVLAVAQELDESDRQMAEMLGVTINKDGFMAGMESMVDNAKNGIFVVGSARGPKGVIHSIEDAKSVTLDILEYLRSS
jgi:heterodisulfide reductase subunit A2